MDVLRIEPTESSPGVNLDHNQHLIEFWGESRPEDTRKFFAPVMDWLGQYKNYLYYLENNSGGKIQVVCNIKLQYFNSSSAKFFMDILNLLKEMNQGAKNAEISVNWKYYEFDEDMQDAGVEFEKLTGLKFNLEAYGDE